MQLRDAMSVGNIAFSDQFFSTTQGLREVKQQLEDELVRASALPRALLSSDVCLPRSWTAQFQHHR